MMTSEVKHGIGSLVGLSAFTVFIGTLVWAGYREQHSEYHQRYLSYEHVNPATVIYSSNKPPTADEMEFVVPRNFLFRDSVRLYKEVVAACYRNNRIQIEYLNSTGVRMQRLFADTPPENTQILFNISLESTGWLIRYQATGASLSDPITYGLVLHLPKDLKVETCK